jgi:hypothetical protein
MVTPVPTIPFQGVTYGAYNTPQEIFYAQHNVSPQVQTQVSAARIVGY